MLPSYLLLLTSIILGEAVTAKKKHHHKHKHKHHHRKSPVFKTEPTFRSEIFNVEYHTKNLSLLYPGYVFIVPLVKQWSIGPSIYSQDGDLVWYGNATSTWRAQDLHVCPYLGEEGNHLCWSEAPDPHHGARPFGRKVIFDNTYTQVGHNYTKAGKKTFPNTHEFQMTQGGHTFLQTVWEPVKMDLRPYCGKKKGWAFDCCIYEIDVKSGKEVYHWCYLDHYPEWETYLYLQCPKQTNHTSKLAGKGTLDVPWDFMHMNAVDKNSEGDYLISSRYLNQIMKIAGPDNAHGVDPGTTLWRLGGKKNEFKKNFTFSHQHAVRFRETTKKGDVISFYDNAWTGFSVPTYNFSNGKIIQVNNKTMTVNLLEQYDEPHNDRARAQGNLQVLPNKNVFMGWGTRPVVSEFLHDGSPLYHADFQRYSYRAFKHQWVGKPTWDPKLVAYSYSCLTNKRNPLSVYASWNGATEVRRWRFKTRKLRSSPWVDAGTFEKSGFETHAVLELPQSSALSKWFAPVPLQVSAEALDKNDKILGSTISPVWKPCRRAKKKHNCDANGCNKPRWFQYKRKMNCVMACKTVWMESLAALILLCLSIEALDYLLQHFCRWTTGEQSESYNQSPDGATFMKLRQFDDDDDDFQDQKAREMVA